MPNPLIDTPQALDMAITASRLARHEKDVRAVRNQRIRIRIAFGMSGCIALLALTAFFVVGDYKAAEVIAMIACLTFGSAYLAARFGLKKALDSLKQTD